MNRIIRNLNSVWRFQEFRKEAEDKQALKTNMTTLGQQLLRWRPSDAGLRDRQDALEQSWLQLMCELPNNEEQLHAAQIELLPSRQALNELLMWMDGLDRVMEEDATQPINNLMDVQLHLQKYKVGIDSFLPVPKFSWLCST